MNFFEQVWDTGHPVCSVEFFPPKTPESEKQFLQTAERLREYDPDFVSMTYGAGGSSRDQSIGYGRRLRDEFGYHVLPHLTCVGHSRDDIRGILDEFEESGFEGIMALRGDPPKGETKFTPHPEGLASGCEMVRFIRESHPSFVLGVAGYPEIHPEAKSPEDDLRYLATKVNAGANFVTTQLFFENADYFRFVEGCRKAGIEVPVLPGVLTAVSWKQVSRFCGMCGSNIPPKLAKALEEASGDTEAETEIGISWAKDQITELLQAGAPGFHLYILNRSKPALELMRRLSEDLGEDFRRVARPAEEAL